MQLAFLYAVCMSSWCSVTTVNVSVNECLFVPCDSLVTGPVQVVRRLLAEVIWDELDLTRDPNENKHN